MRCTQLSTRCAPPRPATAAQPSSSAPSPAALPHACPSSRECCMERTGGAPPELVVRDDAVAGRVHPSGRCSRCSQGRLFSPYSNVGRTRHDGPGGANSPHQLDDDSPGAVEPSPYTAPRNPRQRSPGFVSIIGGRPTSMRDRRMEPTMTSGRHSSSRGSIVKARSMTRYLRGTGGGVRAGAGGRGAGEARTVQTTAGARQA